MFPRHRGKKGWRERETKRETERRSFMSHVLSFFPNFIDQRSYNSLCSWGEKHIPPPNGRVSTSNFKNNT